MRGRQVRRGIPVRLGDRRGLLVRLEVRGPRGLLVLPGPQEPLGLLVLRERPRRLLGRLGRLATRVLLEVRLLLVQRGQRAQRE